MSAKFPCNSFTTEAELIPMDKLVSANIEWLWPNYIPLSTLTLIAGDPGVGKTFLTLFMAAAVSAALPWPRSEARSLAESRLPRETPQSFPKEKFAKQIYCGATSPDLSAERCPLNADIGSVIIVNDEDNSANVMRPRLIALNADLSKIKWLPFVWRNDGSGRKYTAHFNITTDMFALENALSGLEKPKLIIIDPLMSSFGLRDTYRDSHVRAALFPLIDLAAKYKVAVVGVIHLNKGSSNKILSRIMGSRAFSSSARAVWSVTPLPNEENKKRSLFAPVKNNIVENPLSLVFEMKQGRIIFDDKPLDKSPVPSSSLKSNIESSELNRAVDWLQKLLSDGNPLPSKKIFALAKEQGFSYWTLYKARKQLHIYCFPKKDTLAKTSWFWKLPAVA